MKNIKYFIIAISCFVSAACTDEILNRQPLDIITGSSVFKDKGLVDAYISNLYGRLKLNSTFYPEFWDDIFGQEGLQSDESTTSNTWHNDWNELFEPWTKDRTHHGEYMDYILVRDCNTFLKNIKESVLDESIKSKMSAEVRMIRAFTYFEMVKRYGGIPLVQINQDITSTIEELQLPRNTEQEVYDFIGSEVDTVKDDLAEVDRNRFTKYAALALKSRAMLYVGSIAKYGEVKLNGVAGIPADQAKKYFQASYDAALEIINSNKFALYRTDIKEGDLTSYKINYRNIFLVENTGESIFEKSFKVGVNGLSIDASMGPARFTKLYSDLVSPVANLVNDFEMVDGTSGIIDFKNVRTSSIADLLKMKDPRFHASILYDGAPWQNDTIHMKFGISKLGETGLSTSKTDIYKGKPARTEEAQGAGGSNATGFVWSKFLNPVASLGQYQSTPPAIIFRLGEIYLNMAEAAYNLGKEDEAIIYINKIRERAGFGPNSLSTINMDKIIHERRVELVQEGHRLFDLRRWRIAEQVLNGYTPKAAFPYYDYNDRKWFFIYQNAEPNPRAFSKAMYYWPLSIQRTNINTKWVENPEY